MARSSVALFLATTGLITATMGCAKAPEPKPVEGGENGVSVPAPAQPAAGAPRETTARGATKVKVARAVKVAKAEPGRGA
ncbi:MAG: hypothetical protein QUV07_07705 [Cyanobium sp. CZS 25K]|nr:hypothetical protein [Cyanobium sp. CZS25K]